MISSTFAQRSGYSSTVTIQYDKTVITSCTDLSNQLQTYIEHRPKVFEEYFFQKSVTFLMPAQYGRPKISILITKETFDVIVIPFLFLTLSNCDCN